MRKLKTLVITLVILVINTSLCFARPTPSVRVAPARPAPSIRVAPRVNPAPSVRPASPTPSVPILPRVNNPKPNYVPNSYSGSYYNNGVYSRTYMDYLPWYFLLNNHNAQRPLTEEENNTLMQKKKQKGDTISKWIIGIGAVGVIGFIVYKIKENY